MGALNLAGVAYGATRGFDDAERNDEDKQTRAIQREASQRQLDQSAELFPLQKKAAQGAIDTQDLQRKGAEINLRVSEEQEKDMTTARAVQDRLRKYFANNDPNEIAGAFSEASKRTPGPAVKWTAAEIADPNGVKTIKFTGDNGQEQTFTDNVANPHIPGSERMSAHEQALTAADLASHPENYLKLREQHRQASLAESNKLRDQAFELTKTYIGASMKRQDMLVNVASNIAKGVTTNPLLSSTYDTPEKVGEYVTKIMKAIPGLDFDAGTDGKVVTAATAGGASGSSARTNTPNGMTPAGWGVVSNKGEIYTMNVPADQKDAFGAQTDIRWGNTPEFGAGWYAKGKDGRSIKIKEPTATPAATTPTATSPANAPATTTPAVVKTTAPVAETESEPEFKSTRKRALSGVEKSLQGRSEKAAALKTEKTEAPKRRLAAAAKDIFKSKSFGEDDVAILQDALTVGALNAADAAKAEKLIAKAK